MYKENGHTEKFFIRWTINILYEAHFKIECHKNK